MKKKKSSETIKKYMKEIENERTSYVHDIEHYEGIEEKYKKLNKKYSKLKKENEKLKDEIKEKETIENENEKLKEEIDENKEFINKIINTFEIDIEKYHKELIEMKLPKGIKIEIKNEKYEKYESFKIIINELEINSKRIELPKLIYDNKQNIFEIQYYEINLEGLQMNEMYTCEEGGSEIKGKKFEVTIQFEEKKEIKTNRMINSMSPSKRNSFLNKNLEIIEHNDHLKNNEINEREFK